MATSTATKPARKTRARKVTEPTEQMLDDVRRGLTPARYADRFNAGHRSHTTWPDVDLDTRLTYYKFRSDAEEQAFLDGNTWGDEDVETYVRNRALNPADYR